MPFCSCCAHFAFLLQIKWNCCAFHIFVVLYGVWSRESACLKWHVFILAALIKTGMWCRWRWHVTFVMLLLCWWDLNTANQFILKMWQRTNKHATFLFLFILLLSILLSEWVSKLWDCEWEGKKERWQEKVWSWHEPLHTSFPNRLLKSASSIKTRKHATIQFSPHLLSKTLLHFFICQFFWGKIGNYSGEYITSCFNKPNLIWNLIEQISFSSFLNSHPSHFRTN